MSIEQEKNQIINNFLDSFKNKDLYLINTIIFHFKLNFNWPKISSYIIINLQNIRDLQDLKILLKNTLNQLSIFELKSLENNKNKSNNMFLNTSQIKTINNNKRFTNFIKNFYLSTIKDENQYQLESNKVFILPELQLNYILNIQHVAINNNEIESLLTYLKKLYSNLINHNKNLNKYIENYNFSYWAFNYLHKKNNNSPIGIPIHNNDYKEAINTHFDSIFIRNPLEYEKEIDTLKKAWQQKQFRDKGKTKKEYHLPLTKQAKSELSALAKFKNLSENALLEELIHKTYLNEMCDEKGKARY